MIIRPPAVAGTLYEADTQRLFTQLETWLDNAGLGARTKAPKVLIAPHSGYHYSGQVAAKAFSLLEPVYDAIRRVVVIGPSHHHPIDGIALPGCDTFRTPLGDIKVDLHASKQLLQNPMVFEAPNVHKNEHSIELLLPFLQTVLEDFTLVPLVVGQCPAETVATVLTEIWGDDDTLIVASTGLSRHQPVAEAEAQDRLTADAICALEPRLRYEDACGYAALNGLLTVMQAKGLTGECLTLTTSAATNGKKERVRGFGAFAFFN